MTEIYGDNAWRKPDEGERVAVSRSLPGGRVDRGALARGLAREGEREGGSNALSLFLSLSLSLSLAWGWVCAGERDRLMEGARERILTVYLHQSTQKHSLPLGLLFSAGVVCAEIRTELLLLVVGCSNQNRAGCVGSGGADIRTEAGGRGNEGIRTEAGGRGNEGIRTGWW